MIQCNSRFAENVALNIIWIGQRHDLSCASDCFDCRLFVSKITVKSGFV